MREFRIKAPTPEEAEAERDAILNDHLASFRIRNMVASSLRTLNPDQRAILRSYGLVSADEVRAHLTAHVAQLVLSAGA